MYVTGAFLISADQKELVPELGIALHEREIPIVATVGTALAIEAENVPVQSLADFLGDAQLASDANRLSEVNGKDKLGWNAGYRLAEPIKDLISEKLNPFVGACINLRPPKINQKNASLWKDRGGLNYISAAQLGGRVILNTGEHISSFLKLLRNGELYNEQVLAGSMTYILNSQRYVEEYEQNAKLLALRSATANL